MAAAVAEAATERLAWAMALVVVALVKIESSLVALALAWADAAQPLAQEQSAMEVRLQVATMSQI